MWFPCQHVNDVTEYKSAPVKRADESYLI